MKLILKRSRIRFLYTYCFTGVMTLLLISQQAAAAPLTVVQFGAIPDDGQDDTAAMQAAATELCKHPGTTLVYPPGVYNLDTFVDRDTYFKALGSGDLSKIGIFYDKCHDVKITGVGAKIDVKGDFEKKAIEPIGHENYWSVDKMAFNAFIFRDSDKFTVSGFEINGNVEKMTQDVPKGCNSRRHTRPESTSIAAMISISTTSSFITWPLTESRWDSSGTLRSAS